jgi:uncharacterized protein
MSYTKYKLKNTGRIFYYHIETNSLHNSEGESLTLPPKQPLQYYENLAKANGSRKKSNKPAILRILMGHACNYSCSYCMQKDIGNPEERPENSDLSDFIKSIEDNLDLSNLERIELWGGEPLLYWNDMVQLMNYLDKENRHFFISTNGSALRQKHYDFFMNLKGYMQIGISHDGTGQIELRGEEIFDRKSVTETIQKIDAAYPKIAYSFNTVVSKKNYDLFKINDFFAEKRDKLGLKNSKITYLLEHNWDKTDSNNSANHVMTDSDLAEYKIILEKFLDECLEQTKKYGIINTQRLLQNNLFTSYTGVLSLVKLMEYQIPVTTTSNCGADAEDILSMDIKGNIRLCPHTGEEYIAGSINNLKGIRIVQLDLKRKDTWCKDCHVKRLCKSNCPIEFPDKVFAQNCKGYKVWYGGILHKTFELIFGEPVELLENGIENIHETEF